MPPELRPWRGAYLPLLILLSFAPAAPPQAAAEYHYDFGREEGAIYADIMALELDRAQTAIVSLRAAETRNLAADHLESYLDFFRLYLSGDEGLDGPLEERFERRLDRLGRGNPADPHYNYALAEAHLHRSLIDLRFERHLAAFRQLNRAHKLLRANAEKFPDFLLTYKDLGLLHAAVGSIPPQYRWGVELLSSLSGTVAEGRREIRRALEDRGSPFWAETQVLYAFLELHLADRPDRAYALVKELGLRPAANPLHCFVLANLAMRNDRNDEALRLLEAQPRGGTAADFPYLEFMLGQAKLRALDTRARAHFQSFLLRYPGRHFREEAQQKIAWSYLLDGDPARYRRTMGRIGGGSRAGGDEAAAREAAVARPPHTGLLRARLLFDGGYYARARAALSAIDAAVLDETQLLEFNYRTGRVLGGLGDADGALAFYGLTISAGREHPAFYACNAALQAGLLEEKRGNPAAARRYFETCLDIHPAEYRTGLHLLAKARLSGLEK